ncbi:response regulator transcription factor [Alteromonas gracilis]|uniref:helix-turn-helix transcriptional regulator n=1 Tax=Alteromonas gracilis TaxID=1479524 RepID=UPI0037361C61
MSHQAFVLTRNSFGENTRKDEAYERFLSILPSCGFTVTTGAIHPPRSVLNNTHTFFIDAQYCSAAAILNLPVVHDYPELNKVIFNVRESDVDFHYAALQHGINGIFHIEDNLELLVRGVQQVQAGNKWFSREIMSRYIDANLVPKTKSIAALQSSTAILTKRELAITRKIAEGAQNQEIADSLHISVNTVKTHVYSIFRKTECRNRVELIKWFDHQFSQPQQVNY